MDGNDHLCCEVLPGYPDANNKSIIDFNLDGNVLETLNGDSPIESFFGFNFKCEFTGATELEELTNIYGADIITNNVTGVLDSSVLPSPSTCAVQNNRCHPNNNLQLGNNFIIDFYDAVNTGLHFRIESIWVGPAEGAKTIQLVEDGCTTASFASTSTMDVFGLFLIWEAFKFQSSESAHFTIQIDLCNPEDEIYCKGITNCLSGIGNLALFEQMLASTNGRKRRSDEAENDTASRHNYQKAKDVNVQINVPKNAMVVENNSFGETIILLQRKNDQSSAACHLISSSCILFFLIFSI
ncbi:Oidioi.mRNA.OKI2018_I69.PAR.g9124.t1.cds [Oikopleura dioica]|uniref:Oidioi.mRNA.OKI2018_I69.PAR.g9124.t1.cds n=1 Tax=Oikopleura dioica TaxID=34765 RepID=A0ABN7RJ19_OIKDI|nr:Oidioi.mRNA.OKI2018_I69.PAR.g9124.t1.cds [Oikopleura dioica]